MDVLQLAAIELAKEVKYGHSLQFNFNNQTMPACIELLSKLKNRAPGYSANQYVHAISSAIEKYKYYGQESTDKIIYPIAK